MSVVIQTASLKNSSHKDIKMFERIDFINNNNNNNNNMNG
jgi:hypothetical protein